MYTELLVYSTMLAYYVNHSHELAIGGATHVLYVPYSSNVTFYRELLANDSGYLVPEVFPEVSTKRVLTTELIQGIPLDQCASLPQETRNDVST